MQSDTGKKKASITNWDGRRWIALRLTLWLDEKLLPTELVHTAL